MHNITKTIIIREENYLKKTFLLITAVMLIIIFTILGYIIQKREEQNKLISYNKEYEYYLNKQIYGTEVATLINKIGAGLRFENLINIQSTAKMLSTSDNHFHKLQRESTIKRAEICQYG